MMRGAIDLVRAAARATPAYPAWQWWRRRQQVRRWERAGRPPPPPQPVKYRLIREAAVRRGLRVFVETGTYLGDSVQANINTFDRIYTIELSEELHRRAAARFRRRPHVTALHGDSGRVLPAVLAELREPALFWLDGHYSAGITARGDKETPVEAELRAIFAHPVRGHLVLIDDARCFTGDHDYPTVAALEQSVRAAAPGAGFAVEHDIIWIDLHGPAGRAGGT